MSHGGFRLMWGKLLDSSVWMHDAATRLVWITILLMVDKEGVVRASVAGLAHRARVTLDECLRALEIFSAPDPDDSSKIDDGVRIKKVPGGWYVVNHEMYRYSTEERRLYWRDKKAVQRAKEGVTKGKVKPLQGSPVPAEDKLKIEGMKQGTHNEYGEPIDVKPCPEDTYTSDQG